MKIALAQLDPVIGDFQYNHDLILDAYRRAVALGAELVVTPELSLTGYSPCDMLLIPAFRKACEEWTARLAAATGPAGLVFGAPLPAPGSVKLHNCALLAAEGKICFHQAKSLLPSYSIFDETRYFVPGKEPAVCEFRGLKLGFAICEDAWMVPELPEYALYETDPVSLLAEQGAELIVNIAASPWQQGKTAVRRRIAAYHSGRHGLPYLLVNKAGANDELLFDGNSFFYRNGIIAACTAFNEELLLIDTDYPEERNKALPDELSLLHDALVAGIRGYARKCGFTHAVLGLSGGIDSALTAVLACRALGPEKVRGITMPSMHSSSGSVTDSEALAANLGMRIDTVPIKGIYDSFSNALAPLFTGTASGVAEENLQARIRGTLLMGVSNKFGPLLLTTGNKSEMAMGYCTLYGDMNGGLAVLGDVFKTRVYELARYINRDAEIIPWNTITKPPSAELRPNQTDQDSLPPYELLDEILRLHLEEHLAAEEIITRGHDRGTVLRVLKSVRLSEYKRIQAPPVLRVTGQAFGTGRRIPITARFNP
jgi:NAD+ synthase (glutamine-hydrolysing)